MHEHARLAAARAGQHQDRLFAGRYRLALGGVQRIQDVGNVHAGTPLRQPIFDSLSRCFASRNRPSGSRPGG